MRANCTEESRGSGYCPRHYSRLRLLISKYRLAGWDDFDALVERADSKCEICRTPLDPEGRRTHIDHDHTTGAVRGILCESCNVGLGNFHDNVDDLAAAVAYLNR